MNRWYAAGYLLLLVVALTAGVASAHDQSNGSAAASNAAVPAAFVHRSALAPADEYFGGFKMSILGVRNTIADIDARADVAADAAARSLCHKLVLAEEALRDWHAKYPDDVWIPRLGYAMLKDYEKIDAVIPSEEFHDAGVHAIDLSTWLDVTFPNSVFAPK